jgi:TRAP transporter TAXI family solute receptor
MSQARRVMRSTLRLVLWGLSVALICSAASAASRFATIGTGGVTGVYYPAGGAIAKMVNRTRDEHGIHVAVESTGGSVFNINAVMSGDLDFGIAQSDLQYQAVRGLGDWKEKGPQSGLRAVCSLHPEAVTLVAAVDAGIETLNDLRGKRVNIGNPGSGQRANSIDVLSNAGIDWRVDIRAEGLKASECASMLQDGRIDAFFYTVGHPAGAITEATAGRREVRIVPITATEALLEKAPYYAETVIPAALYPSAANTEDIPTIGVLTTLVTSADVPAEVVYTLTRALFENLDEFREQHPAFAALTASGMTRGLTAPLHDGAKRYYVEAGLIEKDATE